MKLADLIPRTVHICHDDDYSETEAARYEKRLAIISDWQKRNRERINARRRLVRPSRAKA